MWREEKQLWAYNKDYYQRALLRRDWYLHREEETVASKCIFSNSGSATPLLSYDTNPR